MMSPTMTLEGKEKTTLTTTKTEATNRRSAVEPRHQSLPFTQFVWGAGIECSFLPHINVDQFQWTQHNRVWRDDFRLAKNELGIRHLRYALPWHTIERDRGAFDWSMADERIAEAEKLGLDLMLDVMHFGTPLWLKQAVGDPEFPEVLERFADAMVTRYRGSVKTWCPFNEPLVSALFSGDFGFWPPHARKWRGYMPVLSRIVQGVSRGIRAIRRAMPEATVLLCDASENYKTRIESLKPEVTRRNARRFLVMDLLLGKLDQHHPLYSWVNAYGMSDLDLEWFRSNPQSPDVLGLDYYPHSDWQVDIYNGSVRQRRAENPIGLYGIASAYYRRYGIPLMLTETSIEGQPINREIWLETSIDHIRKLRDEGIPMLGLIWWPMLDQIDWDGALTHRIGKVHEVGLFNLQRQKDGTLARVATPLVKQFREAVAAGEERIGRLERIVEPSLEAEAEQLPPIGEWIQPQLVPSTGAARGREGANGNGNGNGNGHGTATVLESPARGRISDSAPRLTAEPAVARTASKEDSIIEVDESRSTDRYGIVVFCHLRWGFVWQRPQQFLSRFAKKHPILFVEEPFFDLKEGSEPRVDFHRVMPNVTVMTPHMAGSWNRNPKLPAKLREFTQRAIDDLNEGSDGAFDAPVLWYYSPMDSAWSLGHFKNRGVVYDAMDELSQFTGAPKSLIANEARLMQHADIVFTGGYELSLKKKQRHENVHFFGCGVEVEHFGKAREPSTPIPPDIDFMARPILGWFGVVDERVDYAMVGEMARMRPEWSFAMVGPVVKVDPNLLPHFPNLYWLGGRDYQVLPNYCKAFDICMMSFAINAATEFINPTKALEYLATGRPVISTPVKDVVRQYSDLVDIVKTPEEFVEAAERALKDPPLDRIKRGLEKAKGCGWENTVASMQTLIKEAVSKPDRPSRRKIEPLSQAELEYHYQPTPGS
jgi:beta-glucosidase/6-phospho-beta-glucosidase/beta-galactosidase/glycosyltransferase involved in cell wall biosynthesis